MILHSSRNNFFAKMLIICFKLTQIHKKAYKICKLFIN